MDPNSAVMAVIDRYRCAGVTPRPTDLWRPRVRPLPPRPTERRARVRDPGRHLVKKWNAEMKGTMALLGLTELSQTSHADTLPYGALAAPAKLPRGALATVKLLVMNEKPNVRQWNLAATGFSDEHVTRLIEVLHGSECAVQYLDLSFNPLLSDAGLLQLVDGSRVLVGELVGEVELLCQLVELFLQGGVFGVVAAAAATRGGTVGSGGSSHPSHAANGSRSFLAGVSC